MTTSPNNQIDLMAKNVLGYVVLALLEYKKALSAMNLTGGGSLMVRESEIENIDKQVNDYFKL